MNSILIAEDEKFIRLGLKAMIARADVPVREILEARDGEEAWAILKSRPIDLLITDIRMPKLDGIELVGRLSGLANPPLVLVVSGYDDFNYAVAMMRQGVQNYLLKPVEREKMREALAQMQALYEQRSHAEQDGRRQFIQAIRLLMLEPDENCGNCREALARYAAAFPAVEYVACITSDGAFGAKEPLLSVPVSERHTLSVVAAAEADAGGLSDLPVPVGISAPRKGLDSLRGAYLAALRAWKLSFFTLEPERERAFAPQGALNVKAEQLFEHVGVSRAEETCRLLKDAAARVKDADASPDAFCQLCERFIEKLCAAYPGTIDPGDDPVRFAALWTFGDIESYLRRFGEWISAFCARVEAEFSDFENKQKIRQAVAYLHDHFTEPINMAMVSNDVSMNYTIFSLLFKQYTGMNFVSYLQGMRVREAMRLLETTDWRVNEIGRRAGFSDEKHFLKVFKAVNGLSPSEYRRSKRLTDLLKDQQ